MNKWVHYLLQAIGVVAQIGNVATNYVPPKYQPIVAAVVGLAQAILHVYATNHNPDGTAATLPYVTK